MKIKQLQWAACALLIIIMSACKVDVDDTDLLVQEWSFDKVVPEDMKNTVVKTHEKTFEYEGDKARVSIETVTDGERGYIKKVSLFQSTAKKVTVKNASVGNPFNVGTSDKPQMALIGHFEFDHSLAGSINIKGESFYIDPSGIHTDWDKNATEAKKANTAVQ